MNRFKPLALLALCLALALLAGCAGGKPDKLAFADVTLTTEPASPVAGQETRLIVHVANAAYAKREADVQLQINANSTLPQLIDATRDGETYTAKYVFPKGDNYNITIHMYYGGESDHYAFARPLKVTG